MKITIFIVGCILCAITSLMIVGVYSPRESYEQRRRIEQACERTIADMGTGSERSAVREICDRAINRK